MLITSSVLQKEYRWFHPPQARVFAQLALVRHLLQICLACGRHERQNFLFPFGRIRLWICLKKWTIYSQTDRIVDFVEYESARGNFAWKMTTLRAHFPFSWVFVWRGPWLMVSFRLHNNGGRFVQWWQSVGRTVHKDPNPGKRGFWRSGFVSKNGGEWSKLIFPGLFCMYSRPKNQLYRPRNQLYRCL